MRRSFHGKVYCAPICSVFRWSWSRKLNPSPKEKFGQPAVDIAKTKRQLIRIRQIDLRAIADAWRTHREFPAVDARSLNCDGKKQVRVVEIVMIEIVFRASEKVVGIKRPAREREWSPRTDVLHRAPHEAAQTQDSG